MIETTEPASSSQRDREGCRHFEQPSFGSRSRRASRSIAVGEELLRPGRTRSCVGGQLRWNRRVRRARPQRPVLITSAERSRREEIRHRETRYVMAMMVRVVFFIVAVVALHSWARFLGMIAAICIPWLAVLYANAGPVRSRKRQPSLYRRDTSALPDDPYPLGDGGQTIVEGEWTGPRSRRDRRAEPAALPPALPGTRSQHQWARRRS